MPETSRQIRPVASAILLALVSAALGACSGGDFGRTRADMRSDDMHRWLGTEVTGSMTRTCGPAFRVPMIRAL